MCRQHSESASNETVVWSLCPYSRGHRPRRLLLLSARQLHQRQSRHLVHHQRLLRRHPARLCGRRSSMAATRPQRLRSRTTPSAMRMASVHRQGPVAATTATRKLNSCSIWFCTTVQLRISVLLHHFTWRALGCRHLLPPPCLPPTRPLSTALPLGTATGHGRPCSVSSTSSRRAHSLGGSDLPRFRRQKKPARKRKQQKRLRQRSGLYGARPLLRPPIGRFRERRSGGVPICATIDRTLLKVRSPS